MTKKITPLQIIILGTIGVCIYLYWDNRRQKNIGNPVSAKPAPVVDVEADMSDFVVEPAPPEPVEEKVLTAEEIARKELEERIEQHEKDNLQSAIGYLASRGIFEANIRAQGFTDTFIIKEATEKGWIPTQFKRE